MAEVVDLTLDETISGSDTVEAAGVLASANPVIGSTAQFPAALAAGPSGAPASPRDLGEPHQNGAPLAPSGAKSSYRALLPSAAEPTQPPWPSQGGRPAVMNQNLMEERPESSAELPLTSAAPMNGSDGEPTHMGDTAGEDSGAGPSVARPQRQKRPAKPKAHYEEGPQHMTRPGGKGRQKITMEVMQAHLNQLHIGFRPGDPTVTSLPDALPPPRTPTAAGHQVIRMDDWTQGSLAVAAAATQQVDCFAALLPNPPGAPPDRLGYFTGQKPGDAQPPPASQRGPGRAVQPHQHGSGGGPRKISTGGSGGPGSGRVRGKWMSSQELVDALHPHLSRAGATEEVPWSVVGRPFGPSAGGKVLPLRGLWEAVQSFGGAEAATTNKKWSAVARELGQDPNSSTHIASTVKSSYMRYLFAYECFRTGKALPDAAQGEEPPLMLNS